MKLVGMRVFNTGTIEADSKNKKYRFVTLPHLRSKA